MKIQSINKINTKSFSKVAFNVDCLPTETEISICNKYFEDERINISVGGECLHINKQDESSLNKEDIDFVVKIIDAVQNISTEMCKKRHLRRKEEQLKCENMLCELSESLGLPVKPFEMP